MKILYLHQYFNTPLMNGGTRSYEMARRMVAAGHEVHLLTSRRDMNTAAPGWSLEQIQGINVHWLPVPYDNSLGFVARLKAFFKFAVQCSRKTNEFDVDVIFATSTPLTIAIPAVFAKKRKRVPMVFEVRDLWPELPIAIGALNSPILIKAARALERWAYKHSDAVVGLSPGMCDGVEAAGVSSADIHNIPNSSDVEMFRVDPAIGEQFRTRYEWLQNRPLVVYAGTFGRINGVGYMVDLAEAMLQVNPQVRFLVVGGGFDRETIHAKAIAAGVYEKNFYIWDSVPKEAVPELYSAATVVTSLFLPIEEMWSNSANKFFDGLAAGKPVVINYGGWQAELLEKNSAGLTLNELNVSEATEKLHDLLEDDARLKRCGEESARLGSDEFSRDLLAEKLISVIENVVTKSRLEKQVI